MRHKQVINLTFAAMLAAMCCVGTMAIQFPTLMGGYIHLGDCFVLLSGFLLGPFYGAAAAGIGSMLADIFSGYALWAPGTLMIKALCALIACLVYAKGGKKTVSAVLGAVLAEAFMVLGYFAYAALLLGNGLGAAAEIPGNAVQGVFGAAAGVLLLKVAEKYLPALRREDR
ncbi:MAG: ECF transporter S component [Oscillospiraceae bacterium]